jgi:hypothetical protein
MVPKSRIPPFSFDQIEIAHVKEVREMKEETCWKGCTSPVVHQLRNREFKEVEEATVQDRGLGEKCYAGKTATSPHSVGVPLMNRSPVQS